MTKPTALYRFFDADDTLLYVGITENPDARFKGHESTKSWWPDVARKVIEWHDSREEAETAEDEAIRTEHALHNVAGSPWAPEPRRLADCEMTIGEARKDLTEVVLRVRLRREMIVIVDRKREREPVAVIVPAELGDAIRAAGGPDATLKILGTTQDAG